MDGPELELLRDLSSQLDLSTLLRSLKDRCGAFEIVDHHQQGEFHHDTVIKVRSRPSELPGDFLVVATNCNGGVKEVLCFAEQPTHGGLWRARCPTSDEFTGALPEVLGRSTTHHFFNPCDLLRADARSEYREEFRERQAGGGWVLKGPSSKRSCGRS